jgi:NAD(P)-dependent dehydrogenase (short-subunit alcohol dehydrogenase family)
MERFVIVTGASSGIGIAACIHLKELGFTVLGTVRQRKDQEILAKRGIQSVLIDLNQSESEIRAILAPYLDSSANRFEWSLVNNAGIVVSGPVELVSQESWEQQFAVNFFGAIKITRILLPHIRATRGRIVNISSVSGIMAMPFLAPYAASKFALEAFSDSLRRELLASGAQVVLIEPGPVATPIWEKGLKEEAALTENLNRLPNETRQYYFEPLQRFLRFVKKSQAEAVPVEWVAHAVGRALVKKKPRAREVVGPWQLKWQACLLPLLPTKMLDSMVARSLWKRP